MSVGKKNIILACVLCASIAVIGVSFAYFTSKTSVTGDGSDVTLTPGDMLKVSYDAGSDVINLENAIPGQSDSKDFSVSVTPTDTEKKVTYAITLDISENTFEKCDSGNQAADNMCTIDAEELTYTLRNSSGVLASGNLTETSGRITLLKETKTVEAQTTFDYTLEITYVNTGADQNHNTNKSLTGNIKVIFAEE